MTESQYRRSNRTVLALIVVILVYFVMVMGARTFTLDADLGTYLRVGVPVLMLVGAVVSYVLWKDQKKGALGMIICASSCLVAPSATAAIFSSLNVVSSLQIAVDETDTSKIVSRAATESSR